MANLKELRTRIASVKTTMQVTSAMKMVSAAKLRKAQNAITQLRPFADKLTHLLVHLLSNTQDFKHPILEDRDIKRVLIIPISSNRGLCGAFNSNVEKLTNQTIEFYQSQSIEVELFTIGKKIFEFASKRKLNLYSSDTEIFDNINFEKCHQISQQLLNDFLNQKFDKIEFIYHKFKSAGSFRLVNEQFLPLVVDKTTQNRQIDYIIEPDIKTLIERLLPMSIATKFNQVMFDSIASEHGARMTAMHQATENASELIRELTLNYNKARQASITKEIIEIVSGAEALKG